MVKYEKDFTKIKFESNDELPLGKILNIPACIIIVRSAFEEDGKHYPQVLLHECLFEYEKQNIINSPVVSSFNCSVNKIFYIFFRTEYFHL